MPIVGDVKFDDIHSPAELVDYAAEKYSDKIVLSFYRNDQIINLNYLDFQKNVQQLAAYLNKNAGEKQHICLIGDNCYEWIVSFYAISYIGAVSVPIDCSLGLSEITDRIAHAESKYVVFDEKKNYGQALVDYATEHGILVLSFDECAAILSQADPPIDSAPAESAPAQAKQAAQAQAGFSPEQACSGRANCSPDDAAIVVFTSGTSGKSKAVVLTNHNLMSDMFVCLYLIRHDDYQNTIAILPPHHVFQLTTGVLCPLYLGCQICIGKGIKYFAQSIKTYKPSILMLVPLAIETISKNIWANARKQKREKLLKCMMAVAGALLRLGIDIRKKAFKSLHEELGGKLYKIVSGGAPLDEKFVKEFKTWGIDICNGYGITECSPVVACNMPPDSRKGSVGKPAPAPYCEVKIVDGEILIRGYIVTKGYLNDKQATQEAFDGDWFKTGDLGRLDRDGYLYITGRAKNLIILSNGENVSPEELEEIFAKTDGIKDIVVTERRVSEGKGNERTVLAAIIVPQDGMKPLGEAELQRAFQAQFERINAGLPAYKRVYHIEVRMEDFEKTALGKIKRIKENYQR